LASPWYWTVYPDPPQPELTRVRVAGRPLRPRGENAWAIRGRPSFHREHRPGPPDPRPAPL